MNPNNLTKNDAMIIISRGQLFCPAYLHYGSNLLNVKCSGCGMDNLPCCVGYESFDLCMGCVNTVTKSLQPQQNFIKQINQANQPNQPEKPNQFTQVQTDNLNIRPVNDFDLGNQGGNWTDLFDSSLNPSGISYKPKPYKSPNFFTQTRSEPSYNQKEYSPGYSSGYSSGCSNQDPRLIPNKQNNKQNQQNNPQAGPNYLETFYQPLNPQGLPKRG